jgi:hypothetical protein
MANTGYTSWDSIRGRSAGRAGAEFWREYGRGLSHQQRLNQVRFIARLMDDQFGIPGTRIRFGLDTLIGFFPGLGDAVTSLVSLLIVHHAWQSGVPKLTIARMLGNVGIDFVFGAIPLVGDLFDVMFKANRKNARLLEAHLNKRSGKWEVD